jgi:hypothetical protein
MRPIHIVMDDEFQPDAYARLQAMLDQQDETNLARALADYRAHLGHRTDGIDCYLADDAHHRMIEICGELEAAQRAADIGLDVAAELRDQLRVQAGSLGDLQQQFTDAVARAVSAEALVRELTTARDGDRDLIGRHYAAEGEQRAAREAAAADQAPPTAERMIDPDLNTVEICADPETCDQPDDHPNLTASWAVPKCEQNRIERGHLLHPQDLNLNQSRRTVILPPLTGRQDERRIVPELYCESAYCRRCAAYRRADGVDPLLPNAWLQGS